MTEQKVAYPTELELMTIEREARRLRAQVMRRGVVAAGAWLRSRLSFGGRRPAEG